MGIVSVVWCPLEIELLYHLSGGTLQALAKQGGLDLDQKKVATELPTTCKTASNGHSHTLGVQGLL